MTSDEVRRLILELWLEEFAKMEAGEAQTNG